MSASRKSTAPSRWAQPAAIAVVIVVHGLMLGVLLRSPAPNGAAEDARLAVYWLPRSLPAPAPPPSVTFSLPAPQPPASPRLPAPRVATLTIASPAAAVDPQAPRAALDLSVPGSLAGAVSMPPRWFRACWATARCTRHSSPDPSASA